jgi:hypothetical protein
MLRPIWPREMKAIAEGQADQTMVDAARPGANLRRLT